jgi:hypothetical protein
MSEDALGACNGFNTTIVDFGNFHNENRVKRWTVYGKSTPKKLAYKIMMLLSNLIFEASSLLTS